MGWVSHALPAPPSAAAAAHLEVKPSLQLQPQRHALQPQLQLESCEMLQIVIEFEQGAHLQAACNNRQTGSYGGEARARVVGASVGAAEGNAVKMRR